MKSFIIVVALSKCLSVMGTPYISQGLGTRDVPADSPAAVSSSPNPMTCHANSTTKVVDLDHCEKVATYMASNKVPCANHKSCALMTRLDIGKPQAVQVTSATELRYAYDMYFGTYCDVTHPVEPRSKKFPHTIDSNLYLVAALCDLSDPRCPTDEQVTTCPTVTFEHMKVFNSVPGNVTIGATQEPLVT